MARQFIVYEMLRCRGCEEEGPPPRCSSRTYEGNLRCPVCGGARITVETVDLREAVAALIEEGMVHGSIPLRQ